MHVVERYKLIEGGKRLQGMVTIEDPGTFTTKWSAVHYFIKHDNPAADSEYVCAEKQRRELFPGRAGPVPQTKTPDF
jgi:hypothetical protein